MEQAAGSYPNIDWSGISGSSLVKFFVSPHKDRHRIVHGDPHDTNIYRMAREVWRRLEEDKKKAVDKMNLW